MQNDKEFESKIIKSPTNHTVPVFYDEDDCDEFEDWEAVYDLLGKKGL